MVSLACLTQARLAQAKLVEKLAALDEVAATLYS